MGAVKRITLDPVSRIEGHLRVDIDVADGVVQSARSSGTSFRGLEAVLHGRDPRQAAEITQRICGVCPVPHARAASEALEAAAQMAINTQAVLFRNLIQAANYIDSHLLSFYLLSLPDFVAGLPSAGNWPSEPRAWGGSSATVDAVRLKTHALACLKVRQACHAIGAIFGGRMPHPAGIVAGGATARVSAERITGARGLLAQITDLVEGAYAEDLEYVAAAWPEYKDLGASAADLLSFGAFPDGASQLFPPGVVLAGSSVVTPLDPASILESVANSSYPAASPIHPAQGQTHVDLNRSDAYSFVKSPRLGGRPCEVGPLARAVIAGRDPGWRGVWGRHKARMLECSVLAKRMADWLDQLVPDESAYTAPVVPGSGAGAGLTEAPRGSLGHWLTIEAGVVANYGVVSPTTWNASPRDEAGIPGPLEAALAGLHLADPADPIEVHRVIHSFDPCLQCAVH